ncbi:MAG: hypothetical protein JST94_08690 [Bacteroidetes bacterium]|nr:hypothetical protein [Bacteroidota bacterium]MBS1671510.1 hypothetical protein [Bacteroidota bacterium]
MKNFFGYQFYFFEKKQNWAANISPTNVFEVGSKSFAATLYNKNKV